MAESFQKEILINAPFASVMREMAHFTDLHHARTKSVWQVLFANRSKDQAEGVFLTGMFSGAGLLGLYSHGARKAILFAKLSAAGKGQTRVTVLTGGSESMWGFDFKRHENNVNAFIATLQAALKG